MKKFKVIQLRLFYPRGLDDETREKIDEFITALETELRLQKITRVVLASAESAFIAGEPSCLIYVDTAPKFEDDIQWSKLILSLSYIISKVGGSFLRTITFFAPTTGV